jgi:hypothetical protein
MPTITARILQSTGLNSAVGSIASRELGITSDTERPVIGTTVGGPKFLATEGLTLITTTAPAPLAVSRRSRAVVYVDLATAGGDVALDIQAGAQVQGYQTEVIAAGPAGRQVVVTYASGQAVAVAAGSSQLFTWSGTAWQLPIPSDAQIIRAIKEQGRELGEIFALLDRRGGSAWNPANPRAYFPAVCLTDFDSQITLNVTNAPDAVPYLRARKMIFKDGLSGELAALSVTNWAINANVATLTFANTTDTIAAIAALGEDQILHGSYTNWRTITLANAIGPITAGDYALTNVNPSARTMAFAFNSGNDSGAVSASAEFYPFRIPGSTTTARVFSARGLTMHGANDDNRYFVAGCLRRRGFFQGHWHDAGGRADRDTGGGGPNQLAMNDSQTVFDFGAIVRSPKTDGTNGTPRTAKETHGPAMTVHLYMHLGRLI